MGLGSRWGHAAGNQEVPQIMGRQQQPAPAYNFDEEQYYAMCFQQKYMQLAQQYGMM